MSNEDPKVKQMRHKLVNIMTLLSSGALAMPQAAQAYIAGNTSYTKFVEAVQNHEVVKFTIAADGKTGNFFSA